MDKTRYEKISRQEFQSKQDKKIHELQSQLSLAEEQNRDREGEIRVLKQQTAHGRTYSILGFQIILPFWRLNLAERQIIVSKIAAAIITKYIFKL